MDDTFQLIKSLLRSPIAFHRAFADIAGGACNGLFLSQLWYWSQRTDDPGGWIYKTQDEWTDETALSRREQETARKSLIAQGLLQEDRRGLPARLYYRLSIDTLQTRLSESANQACTKAPNKKRQNVQSFYTENTSENTSEKEPPVVPLGTRTRRVKTYFPDDPTEQVTLKETVFASIYDWANEQRYDESWLNDQWNAFVLKAQANAYKYADWAAAFRNWLTSPYQKEKPKHVLPPLVIADDGIPF